MSASGGAAAGVTDNLSRFFLEAYATLACKSVTHIVLRFFLAPVDVSDAGTGVASSSSSSPSRGRAVTSDLDDERCGGSTVSGGSISDVSRSFARGLGGDTASDNSVGSVCTAISLRGVGEATAFGDSVCVCVCFIGVVSVFIGATSSVGASRAGVVAISSGVVDASFSFALGA